MRGHIFIWIIVLVCAALQGKGQQHEISGKILSSVTGHPIEGAEIQFPDENINTLSDENGYYRLAAPDYPTWMTVRYPGYATWKRHLKATDESDIYLTPSQYRSPYKELTGPFGTIGMYKNASFDHSDEKVFLQNLQLSADLAMQGRLPGLTVRNISGMPGQGGMMYIRGLNSLFAQQNPLILIDGVPINSNLHESMVSEGIFNNPLSGIDVHDIAGIEILRDGASLYGVNGGNGIVMIRTIQPVSAETRIRFSAQTGITAPPSHISMLKADEYKTYLVNQFLLSEMSHDDILRKYPWITGNPAYFNHFNHANNTNWQDEVFRMARMNKLNASLQGGDEIARFAVLIGYANQQGVLNNTGYQRYNFRFNSDVRILERLSLVSNIGFSYHDSEVRNSGIDHQLNPITAALLKPPMLAPFLRDQEGNRIAVKSDVDLFGFSNPAAIIENSRAGNNAARLFGTVKLGYRLGDRYHVANTFNVSYVNRREHTFIPDYGVTLTGTEEFRNFAKEGLFKTGGIFNETKISFAENFQNEHDFSAELGWRIQTNQEQFNQGSVYNTPTDEFRSLSAVTSIANTFINGQSIRINRSDLFARSGYRFRDIYLVDLVVTMSASSNTGSEAEAIDFLGGKWGLFPALHVGWIISSEPFMANSTLFDMLKLRASYGLSGNDLFTRYARYDFISRPYGRSAGLIRNYVPNKTIKWEEISQLNAGVDMSIMRNRLTLSFDVFRRITNDLLTYKDMEALSGSSRFWHNSGKLYVNGFDISLHAHRQGRWLQMTGGAAISFAHTRTDIGQDYVIDVPGGQIIIKDGGQGHSFYGFRTDGVYSNTAEANAAGLSNANGVIFRAGDIRFIDQDKNGIIDNHDKLAIGNIFPTLTGGTYASLTMSRFELYMMVDYISGHSLFNHTRMLTESLSGFNNQSISAMYSWRQENDQTSIPRAHPHDIVGNARFSDRWVEDGSFIRLKEISLSYRIPKTSIGQEMVIYLMGQNLLTWSHYLGYNPDFSYSGDLTLQAIDYAQMPVTPMVVAGIRIEF